MADIITVRVDGELLQRLDAFADAQGVSRSAAVRLFVEKGLGTPVEEAANKVALRDAYAALRGHFEEEAQEFLERLSARVSSGG